MTETRPEATGAVAVVGPGRSEPGLAGWLSTADHQRVGRLFVITSLVFLAVAGVAGAVLGAERLDSGLDVLRSDSFGQVASLHVVAGVHLFLMPFFLGLGLAIAPAQVGSRVAAFPRAAALAYWTYLVAGLILLVSYAIDGGPGGGSETAVDLWLLSLAAVDVAVVVGLVSLLSTLLGLRRAGMTLLEAPLLSWTMVVAGGLWLLSIPVYVANLIVVFVSHHHGGPTGGLVSLNWFHDVPQAFLLAVPALGVAAEAVPVMGRVRQQRYGVVRGLIAAIALLGFGAWAQADYIRNDTLYVGVAILVLLPTLGIVAGWADTLRRGRPRMGAPLAASLGAALLFLLAALAGVAGVIDPLELQDTTWVSGQLHLIYGAGLLGAIAALWYWAPLLWGRLLPAGAGMGASALVLLGTLALAVPDLVNGLLGDLPRVATEFDTDGGVQALNGVSLAGGVLLILGVLAALAALLGAARRERDDVHDPWEGHTLEWAASDAESVPVTSPAPLLDARTPTPEAVVR